MRWLLMHTRELQRLQSRAGVLLQNYRILAGGSTPRLKSHARASSGGQKNWRSHFLPPRMRGKILLGRCLFIVTRSGESVCGSAVPCLSLYSFCLLRLSVDVGFSFFLLRDVTSVSIAINKLSHPHHPPPPPYFESYFARLV